MIIYIEQELVPYARLSRAYVQSVLGTYIQVTAAGTLPEQKIRVNATSGSLLLGNLYSYFRCRIEATPRQGWRELVLCVTASAPAHQWRPKVVPRGTFPKMLHQSQEF